jgi:Holliday junction resolvase RusA-like endonuclease
MAKSRRTISTVLPTYQRDRQQWRRKILAKVLKAARAAGVQYDPNDRLEVVVLLYLSKGKRLAIHDVDNRLKDILDALQGRFGPSKSESRLIANDRQICRVLIEKQRIPKLLGNHSAWAGGRLLVRPYKRCGWPLQVTKANRLVKSRKT